MTTEAMKKVMKCLQEVKKVYLTLMIVTQSMRIPQIFMLHHVQWIDLSRGGRGSGRIYGKRGGDDILSNNTLKRLRDNAEALPKLGSRSQKDLSDYSLTTPIIAGHSRQDKQSLRQSEERQTPGRRVEEQTPG